MLIDLKFKGEIVYSVKRDFEVYDGEGQPIVDIETISEKLDFVESEKSFIDNKPNIKYFMTKKGKKAFDDHLKVLETIINSNK